MEHPDGKESDMQDVCQMSTTTLSAGPIIRREYWWDMIRMVDYIQVVAEYLVPARAAKTTAHEMAGQ